MVNVFIKIHLKPITVRSFQMVPLMSPCPPQIIGRVSPNLSPPLGSFRFLFGLKGKSVESRLVSIEILTNL